MPIFTRHITKIVDFPKLKITFLGTETEDSIYIIDGNQKVHMVRELNLKKWIFFSNVEHLKDPDRLKVYATEAMRPERKGYIIPLIKENGIFVPNGIEELSNDDLIYDQVRSRIINYNDPNTLTLPKNNSAVVFEEDGIYELKKNGDKKLIKGATVERPQYLKHTVEIFPSGKEAIIPANNGYFILSEEPSISNCSVNSEHSKQQ